MTTDTTALQEHVERALWGVTQVYDARDGRGTEVGVHAPVHEVVDAVLSVISAEVQAAKAEAWDEGYLDRSPYGGRARSRTDNPYRATEYETGDRA